MAKFQVIGSDRRGRYSANARGHEAGYATRAEAEEWMTKLYNSRPGGNYWIEENGERR